LKKKKKQVGYRHNRRLRKYSEKFNKMFKFFYLVNRSGIIDFRGTTTNQIVFDLNGLDSRECFRLHEEKKH
jgi:hypothetical protein